MWSRTGGASSSTFERPVESIFDVWQVHSAEVIAADRPRPLQQAHQKADAIVTDRPEITLFMRFGDCVPILFFDPIRRIVAIAHAGWQGTVAKIVQATVQDDARSLSPAVRRIFWPALVPRFASTIMNLGEKAWTGCAMYFGMSCPK